MRILYFTRSDTPHDHRFLKAIKENGHEIFALRLEQSPESPNTPEGVVELAWKGSKSKFRLRDIPFLIPRLKKIVNQIRPDLVHAGPIQGPAFLAAMAGVKPLVSMSWGYDMLKEADKNGLTRCITQYTLRHSDRLIVDCQAVLEKAVEFGYDNHKIATFPWGVDLNHFSHKNGEQAAKTYRIKLEWEENFMILGTRALEPIYGMDILAKAFVLAYEKDPSLRLLLLGEGSQRPAIERILTEGGVIKHVVFGGKVSYNDLPGVYSSADLYTSPSYVDGSSVSLLEALACGLPCIVSDIPGNKEWITDDETGWLFHAGDPVSLADKILKAKSSQKLSVLKGKARKLAESKADWTKNFQVLNKIYEKLVKMREL
ncbi:MAG: glycosyltransferase [Anaerolineaceae bacterium]|nr:glycosyltransferase [Anaerolineaceae bacterium]